MIGAKSLGGHQATTGLRLCVTFVLVSCYWSAPTAGAPAKAAPDEAKIEAFVERCEAARRGAIAQLEHTLRGLRNGVEREHGDRSSDAARRIKKTESDLRLLRANNEPVVPTLVFPPSAGAIGRLPRLTCHVDQVISPREILVRCFFPVKVTTVRHFQPRGETVVHPVTFLIRGVSTDDIQEGSDIELLQVFAVTGQETYKTIDGRSLAVWVVGEFDMAATEPYFRRAAGR